MLFVLLLLACLATPVIASDDPPDPPSGKQAVLELKKAGPRSVTYWIVLDGKRIGEINIHTHRSKTGKSMGHTVIWGD